MWSRVVEVGVTMGTGLDWALAWEAGSLGEGAERGHEGWGLPGARRYGEDTTVREEHHICVRFPGKTGSSEGADS